MVIGGRRSGLDRGVLDQGTDILGTPCNGAGADADGGRELAILDAFPPRRLADGVDPQNVRESQEARIGQRWDISHRFVLYHLGMGGIGQGIIHTQQFESAREVLETSPPSAQEPTHPVPRDLIS